MLGLWRIRLGLIHLGRWVRRPFERAAQTPRFAANRWRWMIRSFFLPAVRIPCVVRHPNGACFRLADDPLDDIILRSIYATFRELFLPDAISQFPPEQWILDVGAHHGMYSVAALVQYPGSRLIAVEPQARGVQMLRRNLALNHLQDRAQVVEGAIAGQDGSGVLQDDGSGSWGNFLAPPDADGQGDAVKTYRLDSILDGRKPVLVKCNAEGGEFDLVPQMFQLDVFPTWLILMVHPDLGDMPAMLELIRQQGYTVQPQHSTESHPRFLCTRQSPDA